MLLGRGFQTGEKTLLKNWFYLFLLLCTGFIYASGSFPVPAVFFILASMLACCILIFRIDDPVLRAIILIALAVRVGLALIQAYTAIDLPGAGADSTTFESEAWKNTLAWLYGGEGGRATGAYYYSSWIGVLYIFFGRIEFIPQLMNVYFSLLTLFIFYKTVCIVTTSVKTSQLSAFILAVMPSINSFSVILLREAMIILFIVLSFYFLVKWMKQGRIIFLGGSFFALVAAGAMHGPMFLLFAIHLIFLCFFNPREQRFKLMYWQLIPAAVFIVLAFLLLGNIITYQLPVNLGELFTPDFMRTVVERKQVGRTSYLQEIVPYTYFDLMWQTPLRMIYFLFAPFPWAIENLRDLMGFLENILYAALFYFAYLGSKQLWGEKKHVVLSALLIAVSLVVMFSWGTTNYGTAWRHKQKIAPFVIVLASTGLAARPRLKKLFSGNGVLHKDEEFFLDEDLPVAKDENC